MRRILFDGTHLSRNASGIGTYIVELLRHLVELPTDLLFKVVVHESARPQLEDIELGPHFALEWVPEARFPGNANFRRFLHSNRLGWAERDAVVFHASQFEVDLTSSHQIVTVHDLIPLDHHTTHMQRAFFRGVLPRALARAERIVTPSKTTATALCSRYDVPPAKTTVIPHGVRRFAAPHAARTPALPYVLFVGRLTAYRNLNRLAQAFQLVENSIPHDLAIVGEPEPGYVPPSTNHRVRWLGQVSDDELAGLYHGASAFVFPSLSEGFGFTPLEAILCGVPAIVSDAGSLPETCESAAVFVDPYSVDSIAAGLLSVLSDGPLRDRLRAAGLRRAAELSWRRSAESHLRLFEEVAGRVETGSAVVAS